MREPGFLASTTPKRQKAFDGAAEIVKTLGSQSQLLGFGGQASWVSQ